MIHDRLFVCRLDEPAHRKTCGYWYTVTSQGMAHTAFATRAGLDIYLSERGLKLAGNLDAEPSHCAIIGSYRTTSYLHDLDTFPNIVGEHTRTLSNGDWVEAIITTDPDGLRTVHTLNPNVRGRKVFDYRESKRMMGQ